MILIADSGSTKCDWILYNNQETNPTKISTKGLNPAVLNKKDFLKIVSSSKALNKVKDQVKEIKFFGAGCGSQDNQQKVNLILESYFENATCITKEDTMAAVIATTKSPAVVCILGTGSNCCYFDGQHIHMKTPALGYLLMDEASGNYYGKELLKSYYYSKMPKELAALFNTEYALKEGDVLKGLYQSKRPNKYLASFAPFLFKYQEHKFIQELLLNGFRTFVDHHVLKHREALKHVPVHFVGSIAFYGQKLIKQVLAERGITGGLFIKSPVDHIVEHKINIH